ncbi:MAG: hypothetical protein AAFX99_17420, partial [Myxococcota bacterium]
VPSLNSISQAKACNIIQGFASPLATQPGASVQNTAPDVNTHHTKVWLVLWGAALVILHLAACGDEEEPQDCNPNTNQRCQCTDADGIPCEASEEGCVCEERTGIDSDTSTRRNNRPRSEFRYVRIDDLSVTDTGESPGADIDAISVVINGEEIFAASSEEHTTATELNAFSDPEQVIGPADSSCMAQNFFALGGQANNGSITVGFGDRTFKNGDVIIVYELGNSLCPSQASWENNPYVVSVSESLDGEFIEVGRAGSGNNTFFIR